MSNPTIKRIDKFNEIIKEQKKKVADLENGGVNVSPVDIQCSLCKAIPKKKCKNKSGKIAKRFHKIRIEDAEKITENIKDNLVAQEEGKIKLLKRLIAEELATLQKERNEYLEKQPIIFKWWKKLKLKFFLERVKSRCVEK